jgi:glucose/arabinose dehydrogenase
MSPFRQLGRALAVCSALAIFTCGLGEASGQPFTVQGPGVNSNDFRVTVFATGLTNPLAMARLSDDSLLVTVSEGANFFTASGRLLRLTDTNLNGVADGPGAVMYSGLSATPTAACAAGKLVLTMSNGKPITVLRTGATPSSPLSLVGQLIFTYPPFWSHLNSGLAVRKTTGFTNRFDVMFQVGSESNFSATARSVVLTNSNISGASGTLAGEALHQITLIDDGVSVSATNLVQIASGLRNPSGVTFHPATGDLYFVDNGIDGLTNVGEAYSADELNYIARTNLGGPVEFFGYPSNYVAYRAGTVVGGAGVAPLMVFQPIPDPYTGAESEGPNQLTWAPPGFPDSLNQGVFIGFHGVFSRGGTNNEENPLVFANPATGEYFHFIRGQQPGIGHFDGLLATRDSLFVSDLGTNGDASFGAGRGVIYQIKSLVTPTRPSLTVSREGGQVKLTWDRGTLQEADKPTGVWSDVVDAFSPLLVEATAARKFYRTKY